MLQQVMKFIHEEKAQEFMGFYALRVGNSFGTLPEWTV